METVQFILSIIGTAGGSAFITAWFSRRKINAETDNIISKTYEGIIDNLRVEVKRLEERLSNQEQRELEYLKIINQHKMVEAELREKIRMLEKQINELNRQI